MSIISNLKLSTNLSILIAGTIISVSIISSADKSDEMRSEDAGKIDRTLIVKLTEIHETIKQNVVNEKEFDKIFSLCMEVSNVGVYDEPIPQEFNNERKRYCLSKILKTEIQ